MAPPAAAPALRPMTAEEYLDWEARQEIRYEFDGFGPVAMTGGTDAHSAITVNLIVALGRRLRGGPCRLRNGDLKVKTGLGTFRYPDALLACGPRRIGPGGLVEEEPTVLFEVLSPSTARGDRTAKAREYQATPSVRRYAMLEGDGVGATVYAREGDRWVVSVLGPGDALDLPEAGPGVSVPLDEVYADTGVAAGEEAP